MKQPGNETDDELTDFGFEKVRRDEKTRRVGSVFTSVAQKYDVMNDVMSLGIHRLWKRYAVNISGIRPGERVLDLAGGTGDLTALLAPRVGVKGSIILSDINHSMMTVGRARLMDKGIVGNIGYVQANAESLPFADCYFDCVTMAFGLRNVTDKAAALAEIRRVLRPSGRLLVLEFSHPVLPGLSPLYDAYSFSVLPFMGKRVADDADSYRYLAESIRMHPDQDTLKAMMQDAGLERCEYFNLSGGIVALHRGYRL